MGYTLKVKPGTQHEAMKPSWNHGENICKIVGIEYPKENTPFSSYGTKQIKLVFQNYHFPEKEVSAYYTTEVTNPDNEWMAEQGHEAMLSLANALKLADGYQQELQIDESLIGKVVGVIMLVPFKDGERETYPDPAGTGDRLPAGARPMRKKGAFFVPTQAHLDSPVNLKKWKMPSGKKNTVSSAANGMYGNTPYASTKTPDAGTEKSLDDSLPW